MTKSHRVSRKLIFCIELMDGTSIPYKDQPSELNLKNPVAYSVARNIAALHRTITKDQVNRPTEKTFGCSDLGAISVKLQTRMPGETRPLLCSNPLCTPQG
jgi:hypothetical protein